MTKQILTPLFEQSAFGKHFSILTNSDRNNTISRILDFNFNFKILFIKKLLGRGLDQI